MKIKWMILSVSLLVACAPSESPNAQAQVASAPINLTAVASEATNEWAGRYRGELPCPNCDYIEAELTLHSDLSYGFRSRHIGRIAGELPVMSGGHFFWRPDGLIQLDGQADNMVFWVGSGGLEMRGNDGKAYPNSQGKVCGMVKTEAFNPKH